MAIEIDHLGIAVRSLEEGLRFYQTALGMTLSGKETIEAESVAVAMLPTGADTNSPRIELLEATSETSTVARFIERRGPGLHHVALRVDDLPRAIERVKREGGRILNEPRRGSGGHLYAFVHPASTGGVLLELIQKESGRIG
jgi:methylmalonyl-CoA epimerase